MKKILAIIVLNLFWSTFTLASSDVIFEYNEKLLNKKLSNQEVLKICKEYESKNIDAAQYDQMTLNIDIGINNYCSTIKMRSEFKQESKYNLVKDLDIEKFNFNYFTSKDFTISIPILEITKSSSCFVNLKEEKVFDYSQILKSCGIKKFITKSRGNICPASGCELITSEWKEDDELKDNWISIIDYFYADANNDDYMDLIIRFKDDGSVSGAPHTKTAVITSLSKGKFTNINYKPTLNISKNYYNDHLTNCSQSSPSYFSFDSENADITEVEIFKGKKLDINCLVEKFENHRKKFPITSYLSDEILRSRPIIEYKEVKKSKNDNAQYVGLDISSIADQKCGETCIYTTEALLIYDDTYWYIKGNNNRGLKAILESKNNILITNFMSTHQRQYTFENNKIKRVKKKIATTKKKNDTKIFSSSLTGLSFSLTDDWYLSSEASTKELGDKLSGERKEYLKSMLKKSKVSSFEVLYNEKFVPDVITITRLNMPRNFSITKSNVKKNCKQIIKVNEKNTGKKGTLYDCKYVQNRVSGYEGALYISHKDDISIEEGNVIANQIIFIIDSQAVYFSTSCKKYCKEVTENIYAISSTLKKN